MFVDIETPWMVISLQSLKWDQSTLEHWLTLCHRMSEILLTLHETKHDESEIYQMMGYCVSNLQEYYLPEEQN